jgi:hypothetical protein
VYVTWFQENPREYIVVSDDDDEEQLQKASTSKSVYGLQYDLTWTNAISMAWQQLTPGSSKDSTKKRGAISRSDKEEHCQVRNQTDLLYSRVCPLIL